MPIVYHIVVKKYSQQKEFCLTDTKLKTEFSLGKLTRLDVSITKLMTRIFFMLKLRTLLLVYTLYSWPRWKVNFSHVGGI